MHPDAALEVEKEKSKKPKCMEGKEWAPDKKGFVIKVYSICSVQLMITVAACAFVLSNEDVAKWMVDHFYLHYAALIIGVVLMLVLACPCSNKAARSVPLNYILLFAFTAVWSYMVAGFV